VLAYEPKVDQGGTNMLPIRKIHILELDKYKAHLLNLSDDSRRLRFAYQAQDIAVERFIESVRENFDKHKIFAIEDDNLNFIGIAHISLQGEEMELAFSVSDAHQGKGLGSELIKHSIDWCRNRGITKGFMVCLQSNDKMKKLANKCGMKLKSEFGETTANIELDNPTPLTFTNEIFTSSLAAFDHFAKATRKIANDSVQALTFTY
jgi:RimJ/RimL family protein N-acetyltransferase